MQGERNSELLSAFDVFYDRLYNYITTQPGSSNPSPSDAEAAGPNVEDAVPSIPALDRLSAAFDLSRFERDLLVLAAAAEVDGRFVPAFIQLQGADRPHLTYALAFALSTDPDPAALASIAPTRYFHLVEVEARNAGTMTLGCVRIAPRVLQYLLGNADVDDRLIDSIVPWGSTVLARGQEEASSEIATVWKRAAVARPILQFCGPHRASKREIARRSLEGAEIGGVLVDASTIPREPAALASFVRLWRRELNLTYDALIVDCDGEGQSGSEAIVVRFLRMLAPAAPVGVIAPKPLVFDPIVSIVRWCESLTAEDRQSIWQVAVGEGAAIQSTLAELAVQYDFPQEVIRGVAVGEVASLPDGADGDELGEALRRACRLRVS